MSALPIDRTAIGQSLVDGCIRRAERLIAMGRRDEAEIAVNDAEALRQHYGLPEVFPFRSYRTMGGVFQMEGGA